MGFFDVIYRPHYPTCVACIACIGYLDYLLACKESVCTPEESHHTLAIINARNPVYRLVAYRPFARV